MQRHQAEHKRIIHTLREKYHRPEETTSDHAITMVVSTTTTGSVSNERPKLAVLFIIGIAHTPNQNWHVEGISNVGWLLSFSWVYSKALHEMLSEVWGHRIKSDTVKTWPTIASLCRPRQADISKRNLKTPVVDEKESKNAKIRCGSLTFSIQGNLFTAENKPECLQMMFKTLNCNVIQFRDEVCYIFSNI